MAYLPLHRFLKQNVRANAWIYSTQINWVTAEGMSASLICWIACLLEKALQRLNFSTFLGGVNHRVALIKTHQGTFWINHKSYYYPNTIIIATSNANDTLVTTSDQSSICTEALVFRVQVFWIGTTLLFRGEAIIWVRCFVTCGADFELLK